MAEIMTDHWRVKDVDDVVRVVPDTVWQGRMDRWNAVSEWAHWNEIEAREITEPGRLFASEQVAEMFAKCRKIVWEEVEYSHNVASKALDELDKLVSCQKL